MPTWSTSSVLLLVGPEDMEQQQPHQSQTMQSSMIYFPLTQVHVCVCVYLGQPSLVEGIPAYGMGV